MGEGTLFIWHPENMLSGKFVSKSEGAAECRNDFYYLWVVCVCLFQVWCFGDSLVTNTHIEDLP